jgi:hypothetical protein
LTAEQALAHPYVAQFHSTVDEPSCTSIIKIPIDDYQKYSIGEYPSTKRDGIGDIVAIL